MRHVMAAVALAALGLAPAGARETKPAAASPKDSADRFNLDLAPTEEDATVAAPAETRADATPSAKFSLDTPIAQLLADYRSKAVLDKDMPGLSTDKNLDKFKALSLNRLAPQSGGRLSPELLETVGQHLAAIE